MRRSGWRLTALLAAAAVCAAAWFALNAPQLARPGGAALGVAELPEETAPVPPGAAGVPVSPPSLARPLFAAAPNADPTAAVRALPAPAARLVLAPPAATPDGDRDDGARLRGDRDRFAIAPEASRPRLDQYVGPPTLSDEMRASDLAGIEGGAEAGAGAAADPSASGGAGPAYARVPTPNPRREGDDAPETEPTDAPTEPEIAAAPGDTPAHVAAAATERADPDAVEPDGLVLLGVFQSPGASRALVRTATDGAKRVAPGDEIEGWRVASIGEDHIRLRRASQTRLLKLLGAQ